MFRLKMFIVVEIALLIIAFLAIPYIGLLNLDRFAPSDYCLQNRPNLHIDCISYAAYLAVVLKFIILILCFLYGILFVGIRIFQKFKQRKTL